MNTYHTKVFSESLFENIGEWLNSFQKPENKSNAEYNMKVIDYTIIPGTPIKCTIAVITVCVFTCERPEYMWKGIPVSKLTDEQRKDMMTLRS